MLMKQIASTSFPLYHVKNTWKSVHPFETYDSTDRQKGTEFLKIGRSSKQTYFLPLLFVSKTVGHKNICKLSHFA